MIMQFYEKLDLLMNVTKTSNSALGQKGGHPSAALPNAIS